MPVSYHKCTVCILIRFEMKYAIQILECSEYLRYHTQLASIMINVIYNSVAWCDTQLGTTNHNPLQINVGVVVISAVPYLPERREETTLTTSIHACLKRCWRHYTSSFFYRLRRDARSSVWYEEQLITSYLCLVVLSK